tara:strand:- start:6033 stop:6518 length:486 start_codon:yes stop_codon:yes gene_type:complete
MTCDEIAEQFLRYGPIPCLTAASLKRWREENRPSLCPITDEPIDRAHADHCHRDGRMRGAIEGAANIFLGKIENFQASRMARYTKRPLPDKLRAVADYLERETPLLWHPSHRRKVKNRFKNHKKEKQLALLRKTGIKAVNLLTNGEMRATAFVDAVTTTKK